MEVRLSGNDYTGATLPKSYLIVIEIIMQSQDNSNMLKLTKWANLSGRKDGQNLIIKKLI